MEKNIHLTALRFKWPPGSWDHLSVARAARLFEAAKYINDLQAAALPDLDDLDA